MFCDTDWIFNWISRKNGWICLSALRTIQIQLSVKGHLRCDGSHLKAVIEVEYSLKYLNMVADCFPLKPPFSKGARLWRLTYECYVLHAFMLICVNKWHLLSLKIFVFMWLSVHSWFFSLLFLRYHSNIHANIRCSFMKSCCIFNVSLSNLWNEPEELCKQKEQLWFCLLWCYAFLTYHSNVALPHSI